MRKKRKTDDAELKKSQTVRRAVRALTRHGGDDPLLRASGMIDGLPSDLSAQFGRCFAKTFVAEKPARHEPRAQPPKKTIRP